MEIRAAAILSGLAGSWVLEKEGLKGPPMVPPVQKTEGSVTTRVGDGHEESADQHAPPEESPEDSRALAEEVQGYLSEFVVALKFEILEETGEVIVRVVDRVTGEVLREIPLDGLMALRDQLQELRGVLFDGRI